MSSIKKTDHFYLVDGSDIYFELTMLCPRSLEKVMVCQLEL